MLTKYLRSNAPTLGHLILLLIILGIIVSLFISGRASCISGGKRNTKSGSSGEGWAGINAPSGLTATAISFSQINLSWTDNSNNEDGFEIYRSTDGTNYELLTTTNANVTSYSDTIVSSSLTCYYRVRAYNTVGDQSAWSNVASAFTFDYAWLPVSWTAVAAGGDQTLALTTDGTIWGWGLNDYWQLGLGDTNNRIIPTLIEIDYDYTVFRDVVEVVTCKVPAGMGGFGHTIARKSDGTIWGWGRSYYGQLGLGTIGEDIIAPIQIGIDSDWSTLATGYGHTIGRKTSGTIWSWGWNYSSQLGLGYTSGYSSGVSTPSSIGAGSDWSAVAAGYSRTLALKTNGTIWGWGFDYTGIPSQIGTDSDWSTVATGGGPNQTGYHSIALKTNGTIWTWGKNGYGQLGLGDYTNRNTPSQIGTDSDWSAVEAGGLHTLAIKTNRTIWAWGYNIQGQLGLGDGGLGTERITPTQIGSATDWSMVAGGMYHTISLKTNGTIWAWGRNDSGQLGLGDTIDRNISCPLGSPTPPSSLNAAIVSSSQIDLSWTDRSYNEAGFKIERKTSATGYSLLATVGANVTLYYDTTVTPGNTYYYRVGAYNTSGDSPYSNEVELSSPEAPSLLILAVISYTQINLFWTNVNGEIGYKIERSFGAPGTYEQIATVGANIISYSDTTVTPSNTYYYRVRGWNPLGESPYSNALSTTSIPLLRPLSVEPPPTESSTGPTTGGYRFSSDVNVQIIALGRYAGGSGGNTTVILWDDSGIELARVTVSSDPGWQWANLPTPINVSAGTFYRVSVTCTTSFWLGYISMPTTRGNITISESCYGFELDMFPTYFNTFNMWGWADIEFVPE